jgi:hypothetical protein
MTDAKPRLRRWLTKLAVAFTVLHLTAMLVRGSPLPIRDRLWPYFSFYGDGLRMATTYGMFARESSGISVAVHGVLPSGERKLLSHSSGRDRTFWQSIVDVRLRKIQRYLIDDGVRAAIGQSHLRYFCREGLEQGLAIERAELELLRPSGRQVVLSRDCRDSR